MSPVSSFIGYALSIGAIELVPEGRKLKSGRMSPYFFNSGLFNTGKSILRLAEAYSCAIDKNFRPDPDVIFGPAYKGVAIAVAIAQFRNDETGYAYNRKEAKDHGTKSLIEGGDIKGKKTLLVEDLVSLGMSSLSAVKEIRNADGIVNDCLVIVSYDFAEAKEAFKKANVELHALTSVPVILEEALKLGALKQNEVDTIKEWFANPHSWGKK